MVEEQATHAALRARLHELPSDIRGLVEALLEENRRLREENAGLRERLSGRRAGGRERRQESSLSAPVPKPRYPDSWMVVVVSAQGRGKRTPLNAYTPQHRGGMGVFDIHLPDGDIPRHVLIAEEQATLFCITSRGRAFRVPVSAVPRTDIRARGVSLKPHLRLTPGEEVAAVTVMDVERTWSHLFIITEFGWVKRLRHNYVGPRLGAGSIVHDVKREGGVPCVIFTGDKSGDLFLVTRKGMGIRFPVTASPGRGGRGISLMRDDHVVGAVQLTEESTVLMVTASGLGARRSMRHFTANKSPGGKGKMAMKADDVVAVVPAEEGDEVFVISSLAKIIRFPAGEVPERRNPVQGVTVMTTRGDEVVAVRSISPVHLA